MKVLYFGNEHLAYDSLAVQIAQELSKEQGMARIEFVHVKDPSEINEHIEDNRLVLMDCAASARKVELIDDVSRIISVKTSTAHDFDLGFYLNLYKEIGEIKDVKIIALPIKGDLQLLKKQAVALLEKI